jgi:nicotinate-nucleotide adenylyltransferase
MTARIGLYPGTFDPPHTGHLAFARQTLSECRLDRLIFLPEPHPAAKPAVTDLALRLQWLRQLLRPYPAFEVLALPDEQFSVARTWPRLEEIVDPAKVTLLIGSDKVSSLPSWPGLDQLLSRVSLAIGLRHPDNARAIEAALASLRESTQVSFDFRLILTNQAHMASSRLRQQAKITHVRKAKSL